VFDSYVSEAQGKLPPRDTGFGRQDFGSNQRQQQQQQQQPPAWQDQVIHPLFNSLLSPVAVYFCPVVSSFFFFLLFFPRLISAVADWMSAILPHVVWP